MHSALALMSRGTRMTEVERSGIVYALTNPSITGVKIGWTSRSARERAEELFTTGVPEPFDVAVAYRVNDGLAVERALHRAFQPYRRDSRREFFNVEPYQVEAILALMGSNAVVEDVTEEVENNPSLIPNENIRRSRRPNPDYQKMGLPIGAEIICVRNNRTAHVAGRRTIIYEGEEMSLSAATRRSLPDASGNPFAYWRFGENRLLDIYNSVYPLTSSEGADLGIAM
jgi:hypothetical protein